MHCRKRYKRLETAPFIRHVEEKFEEGWSLDAIAGRAKAEGLFHREEMVCTKTLYNYADLGLINIRNIDLPQKKRRPAKKKRVRENKRVLGESITQRPESVESREKFGHWEKTR